MRILPIGVLFFLASIVVAQNQYTPESLLKAAIKFNTANNPSAEKKLGHFFINFAEKNGLCATDLSDNDSSTLIIISLFPVDEKKPCVVLLSHLDVVDADSTDNSWKYPPYQGIINNDTVYGRGAIDMKGISVMHLFSLLKLKETLKNISYDQLSQNVALLLVGNEELGGKKGAEIVCNRFFHKLNPAVVLGEGGAGLKGIIPGKPDQKVYFVSIAEKKNVWIKLESKSRTHGHASVPSDKSANKILLRAIAKVENEEPKIKFDKTNKLMFHRLGEITGGVEGFILKHISWLIFKPFRKKILSKSEILLPMVTNTFTLTKIYNPPGAINQITSESAAYYDCRLMPRFNETAFTLKRLMGTLDPRIKITVIEETPEAPPTKPDKFYTILEESIVESIPDAQVVPYLFVASSDNSYFRSCGIPTYGLMPIEMSKEMIESVHSSNEHIPVKALNDGIEIYYNFLKKAIYLNSKNEKRRLFKWDNQ